MTGETDTPLKLHLTVCYSGGCEADDWVVGSRRRGILAGKLGVRMLKDGENYTREDNNKFTNRKTLNSRTR